MCFLQEVLTVNIKQFSGQISQERCPCPDSQSYPRVGAAECPLLQGESIIFTQREKYFHPQWEEIFVFFKLMLPVAFPGVGSVHRTERGVRAGRGRDREAVRQHPLQPGRGNDGRNIQIFLSSLKYFYRFSPPREDWSTFVWRWGWNWTVLSELNKHNIRSGFGSLIFPVF